MSLLLNWETRLARYRSSANELIASAAQSPSGLTPDLLSIALQLAEIERLYSQEILGVSSEVLLPVSIPEVADEQLALSKLFAAHGLRFELAEGSPHDLLGRQIVIKH